MMTLVLQLIACIVLIALSSFFAGSETGVYRISRFRLRLGIQQGMSRYKTLGRLISDSHAMVLSLLTGNNLSNYLATSLVTYMFMSRMQAGHSAEVYATILMTPLLFIFGDTLPKMIYYYRSDTIMPPSTPMLWFFHKLFTITGMIAILKAASRILNRLVGSQTDMPLALVATGRHHLKQVFQETRDEGIVSGMQKEIMQRLVTATDIPARNVMVKITAAHTVNINTNRNTLLKKLADSPYTRLPVYKKRTRNVVGYINICRVLAPSESFDSLSEFVQPIESIAPGDSVLDAINKMRNKGHKMLLVTDWHGRSKNHKPHAMGILTMKDLLEELTDPE